MGSAPRIPDAEVEARLARLDGLLARLEEMPGPDGDVGRDAVTELAVVYGEGIARVVSAFGDEERRRLAGDPLVGHLLALHGLHPEPVEAHLLFAAPEPARMETSMAEPGPGAFIPVASVQRRGPG